MAKKGQKNALRISLSNFFITDISTLTLYEAKYIMQNEAKIQLSADETELVNNTEWILTKHRVIKKVYALFGEISDIMKKEFMYCENLLPLNLRHRTAKISRGDNYKLLPYVILDYPNYFEKNNILAIRTMFWWGNFFSITLHLSGAIKKKFIIDSPGLLEYLKKKDFSICVNREEWQHHFDEENYLPASAVSHVKYRQILEQPFFKIAKQLPLKQWDKAYDFITENFKEILKLVDISYQGGKKDP